MDLLGVELSHEVVVFDIPFVIEWNPVEEGFKLCVRETDAEPTLDDSAELLLAYHSQTQLVNFPVGRKEGKN